MSYIRKRKKGGRIYLEEVQSVRVGSKVIQKHIRYIGREADKKTILSSSISNVYIEKIKLYGPLLVLNHLSNEIGLSDILGEYGNEVLSLVFAHCMDYKSVNQMARWYERTDLNMILHLDKLTEDRLLKALDSIESKKLEILQKDIFEKVKQIYNVDMKGIIYDVTNTYLHGKKCLLGKLGKDKDGVKGRPLIQIGLGVTRKDGIPIFHKTFDGNISDSRTLYDLITSFSQYKINSGLMVYDRGITSARNLKEIKRLKWDTICGMASNDRLKKIARKFISKGNLTDIKQRIKLNKTVFYTFSQKYTVEGI
ncbi:MAG: IS1634 family transposase, partial [bacterium]|nr:IS1634 family transposase [bacterium]